MVDEVVTAKMKKVLPFLNEAQKRVYLASEAEAIGRGGVSAVSEATGVSRMTITSGMKELNGAKSEEMLGAPSQRIKKGRWRT